MYETTKRLHMRFHEYDNNKSSQPQHTSWQSCAEYDLSTSNGTLVLSTAKPKTTSHPPALVVQGISHKIKQLCKDLFFPIGYPNSVADGYLEYQFYDSLQGLCSYLRGVVSTSAVLSATGVGNAEATAMSAAMVRNNDRTYVFLYVHNRHNVLTILIT